MGPTQLAPVYRALRKAFEDGANEPGAADFYYGEMEMRRHDRTGTTRAERGLLHGYWMLSGYGLRASRALGWLAAAMLVTIMLLMGFGLPRDDPKQVATGIVPPGGGRVTFEIGKEDPRDPTGNRFTGERFEKALNVTLNSVIFRAADQDLTTTGTYVQMTSRVTEPVLLGLAVLAVRNRVKADPDRGVQTSKFPSVHALDQLLDGLDVGAARRRQLVHGARGVGTGAWTGALCR
ncbi:hypothetical protein [Streptomyces olivaceoviridis]|uniref:hypothetical protein n=1 Tax=Streptomyces olivaceoviridis TaxID=1921 RepID=UPI003570FECB